MVSHETRANENISKAAANQPFAKHCISLFPPHFKFVQSKLTINQPNDIYEQEADNIADNVMRVESPFIQTKPLDSSELSYPVSTPDEQNYIAVKIVVVYPTQV
jgi:hypothetical protein